MLHPGLYRSTKDKMISGVCGGIAEHFKVDPLIVRMIFVLGAVFSLGIFFIAYLFMWGYLPEENSDECIVNKIHQNIHESLNIDPPEEKTCPRSDTHGPHPRKKIILLVFAFISILLGLIILFPDFMHRLKEISMMIAVLFLVPISIKILYDVFIKKEYSYRRIILGMISLTYSVFVTLVIFGVFEKKIYFYYFKYLIPLFIVIFGLKYMFNDKKEDSPNNYIGPKKAGMFIVAGLFILIGITAPNSYHKRFIETTTPKEDWFTSQTWMNFDPDFSSEFIIPSSADSVIYTIIHKGGEFEIDSSTKNIELECFGAAPIINTNLSLDNIYSLNISNKMSDSTLLLNNTISGKMNIVFTAGELSADLEKIPITDINMELKAGNAKLELGDSIREIHLSMEAGEILFSIPEEANIFINMNIDFATYDLPSGFKKSNNIYYYESGGDYDINLFFEGKFGNFIVELD